MIYDVITIGDVVNDIFIKPSSCHFCSDQINLEKNKLWLRHGDKILIDEIHDDVGGGACNVAVGLSRLGLKTALFSSIGNDERGNKIINKITSEDVDTKWTKQVKDIKTSTSIILVYKKERTVFVYRGNKDFMHLKIPDKLPTKWIYISSVPKEFSFKYHKLISLACERNIQLALNPGNRQIIEGKNDLLKLLKITKILFVNRREAASLIGLPESTEPKKMLNVIKNYGVLIVVITDGQKGAYASWEDQYLGIPIFKINEIIDPTGAGDGFSSGFMASFINNSDLITAMKWGIINSAQVVREYGAQTALLKVDEMDKLIKFAPDVYEL